MSPAPREPTGGGMLEDLARPEAFPAPRPRKITTATTHASWVFLTEAEAWKVKRPVDFGFLDYADLDARRACCDEEVRLGRRLAPDVYLGVVPVYRGPAGFSFVGPGDIADYAVRMRRLDDADSARGLLAADRLTPDHLSRLARTLAAFYAEAPQAPAELGSAADLRAHIEENLSQSRPYVGRFVSAQLLEALDSWQHESLARHEPRIAQRREAGKIREGHGDLRLEHVYYAGASGADPLVIDPLEFNRRLRVHDVALDVAFLAMELEAQGRFDLAAFFLSRFARDSNDYGFYPLLDLFLSYRACVRAKVACFVAGDPTTPREKAKRKANEAGRLFQLALAYSLAPRTHRHVIAVGGMIASGKSTIADALVLRLGVPAVSSDATRKALHGLRPTDRGGPALYTSEVDRLTYEALLASARSVIESGRGVILDATFRQDASRAAARTLARDTGRPFLFVEVTCDEATIRARLQRRRAGESVSDAGEPQLDAIRGEYRPPDELAPVERVVVDGRAPLEETLGLLARRFV